MDTRIQDGTAPAYTAVKARPVYTYQKRDVACAACALVLGWLFVRAFLFSGACLGAFVFTAAAAALGIFFLRSSGKLTAKSFAGAVITTALALPMLFSANYEMRLLAGFSAFASYIVWMTVSFGLVPESDFGSLISYLSGVFFRPFSRFGDVYRALAGGVRGGAGKRILAAALGLTAAIPLSFIVLVNLARADRNFGDLINDALNDIADAAFTNIVSVTFGILVAMYLFGLLSASRLAFRTEREPKRFVPAGFTLSLTIPLMLCYAAFFAVQTPYYLSAFGGILPAGYSFSEYAVSGFFELVRVAVINAAVCIGVTLFADGKAVRRVTVTILGAMTLILLATAASKLYLYIEAYSLTRKRVYAAIGMTFIALFFILLILRQYIGSLRLTAAALILSALFSAAMTFPDWDGMIAGRLLDRAVDGRQSDLTAVSDLSDSPKVTECLIAARNGGDWSVSRAAEDILETRFQKFRDHDTVSRTPLETVLEFNIAEYASRKAVYEFFGQISRRV